MEETYFKNIPTWNESISAFISTRKRFEVTADEISGRIPVTKIDHWQKFAEMMESDFFNQHGTQWIFRGHRRYDWSLLPTLGRLTENGIVSDDLASKQLDLFRRAVRGRLKDTSLVEDDQLDELWSIGQHHGLMTPLLDWTYSPYVALFFAFAKEDQKGEEDNPYRVIYALNKTFISENGKDTDIRILEPRKDDHGRLVNQAGLFTFSPSDATIENKLIETISDFEEFKEANEGTEAEVLARYICKIYIRNEDRAGCLKSLRRMNVHHASLFPDLIGASDYCNIIMEEEWRQKEIREAAQKTEKIEKRIIETDGSDKIYHIDVPIEERDTDSLIALLKSPPEGTQVEPGRIQLIANQLAKEFQQHRVVDWDKRETVQAKLRNIARVTLRKLGYPVSAREQIVDKLIEVAWKELEKKDD